MKHPIWSDSDMKHPLWNESTLEQKKAASEAADWLIDGVAMATQDRRYLRGDDKEDEVAIEAIMMNGAIACIRAMKSIEENNKGEVK
jgi:hypothetical protein